MYKQRPKKWMSPTNYHKEVEKNINYICNTKIIQITYFAKD